MNPACQFGLDDIIGEYFRPKRSSHDEELILIEAALFVEEAFQIRVSDSDICSEALGSADAMKRFVRRKLEE